MGLPRPEDRPRNDRITYSILPTNSGDEPFFLPITQHLTANSFSSVILRSAEESQLQMLIVFCNRAIHSESYCPAFGTPYKYGDYRLSGVKWK